MMYSCIYMYYNFEKNFNKISEIDAFFQNQLWFIDITYCLLGNRLDSVKKWPPTILFEWEKNFVQRTLEVLTPCFIVRNQILSCLMEG